MSDIDIDLTGPPYPRPPPAGSNGIPGFIIGQSPIGDIPGLDPWSLILSQYANSPVITSLVLDIFWALDQTGNLQQWFDNVLNPATAIGWGLDVWGRIVGINRNIQVAAGNWFGFAEARPTSLTFGEGVFWSGLTASNYYAMTDETYRRVIFAKAAYNITDGSIPSINTIMRNLYQGRPGNAYVRDGEPIGRYFGFAEALPTSETFGEGIFYSGQIVPGMQMAYVFTFTPTPLDLAIAQSGVLPKPTGVLASIVTP